MTEDFAMLEPRPIREPLGESLEPALRAGGTRTETLVDLTRSGWTNPAGLSRSTLQRVTYRLLDNKLERAYWTALDRTLTTEPTSAVLLDKVRATTFRFMDQNQSWHEQWPPLGYSGRTRRVCGRSPSRSRSTWRTGASWCDWSRWQDESSIASAASR